MRIENIGKFLKERNIRPSYQRIKVYQYLIEMENHPTVDTIYKALSPSIPTLSKTTVYNTLNIFIERGIVNVLVIEENETRYDANIGLHGHFKCESCNFVYDIDIDDSLLKNKELEGFQIKENHIYFKGICKNCLDTQK